VPHALTTEFRKLGTVRSPWLLLALGPLIVVAGISGLVASGGNVHDPAMPGRAFAHVGLAAIFTLVFGILAVAGEYSRGTITDTFLSFPARRSVITAKLAAYGAVGAAAGLVSAGVALVVTAAWWSAKGGTLHLSAAETWRTLGGGVAANAALAAIGVGVGALARNLVAAVAGALAWVAVVEGIAGQLIGSGLARWLPLHASESLDRASTTRGSGLLPGGLLPQWSGGLVLLGYAALFAAAALLITLKRDVT
jgi:ABC-2 type transport system permease protein